MSNAEFDKFSSNYNAGFDNSLKSLAASNQEDYWNIKIDVLLRYLPQDKTKSLDLLDYGCGSADFLRLLAARCPGWNLNGCDISEGMLQEAEKRLAECSHSFNLWHDTPGTPLPENNYDLITAVCVFHHIPPDQWLSSSEKIYKALKPGGMFVMFEHNPWNPLTNHIVKNAEIDENAVLLSSIQSAGLLKIAGFVDLKVRHFLFFPPKYKCLSAFEKYLSAVPIGGQYSLWGAKTF